VCLRYHFELLTAFRHCVCVCVYVSKLAGDNNHTESRESMDYPSLQSLALFSNSNVDELLLINKLQCRHTQSIPSIRKGHASRHAQYILAALRAHNDQNKKRDLHACHTGTFKHGCRIHCQSFPVHADCHLQDNPIQLPQ